MKDFCKDCKTEHSKIDNEFTLSEILNLFEKLDDVILVVSPKQYAFINKASMI